MKTVAKQTKRSKRPVKKRPTVTAPLALTSTGQVLINVDLCEGRDLKGRAIFTGALLSKEEARRVEYRAGNAAADAAVNIAGSMPPELGEPASQEEIRKYLRQAFKDIRITTAPRKARRP